MKQILRDLFVLLLCTIALGCQPTQADNERIARENAILVSKRDSLNSLVKYQTETLLHLQESIDERKFVLSNNRYPDYVIVINITRHAKVWNERIPSTETTSLPISVSRDFYFKVKVGSSLNSDSRFTVTVTNKYLQ